MTSQWYRRWAQPILKCADMSYGSNDTFGDFLAHSVQKLWSLIGLSATMLPKGDPVFSAFLLDNNLKTTHDFPCNDENGSLCSSQFYIRRKLLGLFDQER